MVVLYLQMDHECIFLCLEEADIRQAATMLQEVKCSTSLVFLFQTASFNSRTIRFIANYFVLCHLINTLTLALP